MLFRLTALVLASCAALACEDRIGPLEARLEETRAEVDRLSRDLVELRNRPAGPAAAASALGADESARVVQTLTTLRAVLRGFPVPAPVSALDGALPGIWYTQSADRTELLHILTDGRFCGWHLVGKERSPVWGRWERHNRIFVELRDRWSGNSNEVDGVLRRIDGLVDGVLELTPDTGPDSPRFRYRPVPTAELGTYAYLYPDREVPIPGLPRWCLTQ
jgi:hypothetical protein